MHQECIVKYYLFFFVDQLLLDAFCFINNVVVYKTLLVEEKGGKVVHKVFIVNVVSSISQQPDNFDLPKGHVPGSCVGLWIELQWGVIPRGK